MILTHNPKKLLCLYIMLIICLFCGCGQNAEEPVELNERGKEEIQLVHTVYSLILRDIVTEYNTQSDKYEIVVVDASSAASFDDFRNRMQIELSNEKGPDIIFDVALVNLDPAPYIDKGLFLDLTDFLSEQGEFCENVLPTVDGRSYGVPLSFSTGGMVTSEDIYQKIEELEEWTPEACMRVMEESGATVFQQQYYSLDAESAGLYILKNLGVGIVAFSFLWMKKTVSVILTARSLSVCWNLPGNMRTPFPPCR